MAKNKMSKLTKIDLVNYNRNYNEMIANNNKSSSRDEIPERDVTYLLSVYLFTTELRHTCTKCTSGIFSE